MAECRDRGREFLQKRIEINTLDFIKLGPGVGWGGVGGGEVENCGARAPPPPPELDLGMATRVSLSATLAPPPIAADDPDRLYPRAGHFGFAAGALRDLARLLARRNVSE